MICDRCKKETMAWSMSYFNMETICIACSAIERKHPHFKEAVERESAAVRAGNYNFPGIGKPEDL